MVGKGECNTHNETLLSKMTSFDDELQKTMFMNYFSFSQLPSQVMYTYPKTKPVTGQALISFENEIHLPVDFALMSHNLLTKTYPSGWGEVLCCQDSYLHKDTQTSEKMKCQCRGDCMAVIFSLPTQNGQ